MRKQERMQAAVRSLCRLAQAIELQAADNAAMGQHCP